MKREKSNFSFSIGVAFGQTGILSKLSVSPREIFDRENRPIWISFKLLLRSVVIVMEVGVGLSASSRKSGKLVPPVTLFAGDIHIGFSLNR